MIIAEGGYSLLYERNKNRIIIGLPQTQTTATNTVSGVVNRRDRYEDELTTLLFITKLLFEEPETIRAEPVRHGKWIYVEDVPLEDGQTEYDREAWYQCSECEAYDLRLKDCHADYCWSCGAKMDEVNDNE